MTKEIFLSGMTADQLAEMIRESLRDELRQLHPEPSAETPKCLARFETTQATWVTQPISFAVDTVTGAQARELDQSFVHTPSRPR